MAYKDYKKYYDRNAMTLIDNYQDFVLGTTYFGLYFGLYRLIITLLDVKDPNYWAALVGV